MIDMRLERVPFEFDGHTFQLCCNMNVLADVQEAFDGKISEALSGKAGVRSNSSRPCSMIPLMSRG